MRMLPMSHYVEESRDRTAVLLASLSGTIDSEGG